MVPGNFGDNLYGLRSEDHLVLVLYLNEVSSSLNSLYRSAGEFVNFWILFGLQLRSSPNSNLVSWELEANIWRSQVIVLKAQFLQLEVNRP